MRDEAAKGGYKIRVRRAVREDDDTLFSRMFGLQFRDVGFRCEAIVPVFRPRKDPTRPLQEGAEVGVLQSLSAAHEEEGPGRPDRLLHGLCMRVAEDSLVIADPENDRLGPFPVAMKMEHAR